MIKGRKIPLLWKKNPSYRFYFSSENEKKFSHGLEFFHEKHSKTLKQPFFTLRSGQIEILQQPIDFYVHLHRGIRSARERIMFSTLYLGTGNLEKYLVASVNNKLKQSRKLKFSILMDYFRGTRMEKTNESSLSVLMDLKTENKHNPNIKLAFFRNPTVPNIFAFNSESGFRELFGVHHMKFYLYDNDVILTGANLSENYFTERQDRYYLIKAAPELTDYLEDLMNVLANNSIQVEENGALSTINMQPNAAQTKKFKETFEHQFKMFLFSNKLEISKKENYEKFYNLNDENEKVESETTENENGDNKFEASGEELKSKESSQTSSRTDISTILQEKKEKAKTILERSFDAGDVHNIIRRIDASLYQETKRGEILDMGGKVLMFPTIQIPCINYIEEEKFFYEFLKFLSCSDKNHIYLGSGYLNLMKKYEQLLLESEAKVDLLTASPRANGFYQAGRVKKWIPYFYRVFEDNLLSEVKQSKNKKIDVYEYSKAQWTFHSKGIWATENNEDSMSFSVIGSSNFSYRSLKRDNEAQFYLYSVCPEFKKKLKEEQQFQFKDSENVTEKNLRKDPGMEFGFITRLFASLLRSFL